MIVAVCPEKIEKGVYARRWTESLHKSGVKVRSVDFSSPESFHVLKECDGLMWRWSHFPIDKIKAPRILHTIEVCMGLPVYPNHRTCWHYDDKVAQYYMLKSADIPMPETWVFWDKEMALEWAEKTNYPVVFKLPVGASSFNVIKVENYKQASKLITNMFNRGIFPNTMNEDRTRLFPRNRKQLKSLIRRMLEGFDFGITGQYPSLPYHWWQPEKGHVYFQEFLAGNDFDTRIVVIGKRAFGFRRFNRPNDFRASGGGNIDCDPSMIDLKAVDMAFNLSKKMKFQCMAYDFLLKDSNPVISEISYTFPDETIGKKCPGHWDSNLNWMAGNMWPQEAQVEDFIQLIIKFKEKQGCEKFTAEFSTIDS